jgi:KDO2-lipid IV(A) lauroyltransferase
VPLALRLACGIVALLPYRWLSPLGALLGAFAGGLLRIRRAHVVASMARAGVERPERVASAMYASLGTGLLELLWLGGRPSESLSDRFVPDERGLGRVRRAASLGRGIVVATAHTGNWDWTACYAARLLGPQVPLHVVTKRLSWQALDRAWQRIRRERGVVLVDARGAVEHIRAALAQGGAVAMLVDQAPERASGVEVFPFLGAPARHDLAPVLMAARAGAPIVVAFGRRTRDGRHVLEVVDVIDPPELRGRRAIVSGAARIAASLERFILAHPESWLWMHRRWKD